MDIICLPFFHKLKVAYRTYSYSWRPGKSKRVMHLFTVSPKRYRNLKIKLICWLKKDNWHQSWDKHRAVKPRNVMACNKFLNSLYFLLLPISDFHWKHLGSGESLPGVWHLQPGVHSALPRQKDRRPAAARICHCWQCILFHEARSAWPVHHHQVGTTTSRWWNGNPQRSSGSARSFCHLRDSCLWPSAISFTL